MKTKKTRRELERDMKEIRVIFIVLMMGILLLGGIALYFNYDNNKLQTQLSECQDNCNGSIEEEPQRICCYYLNKIQVCWDTNLYKNKSLPKNCEVLE